MYLDREGARKKFKFWDVLERVFPEHLAGITHVSGAFEVDGDEDYGSDDTEQPPSKRRKSADKGASEVTAVATQSTSKSAVKRSGSAGTGRGILEALISLEEKKLEFEK